MSSIKFILGADSGALLENVLQVLHDVPAWQPFDARAVAFVKCLSQKLLTASGVRKYPELVAMGHWFRGANLHQLEKAYCHNPEKEMIIGRGLAFHLAPSNVDSVFMYSWLLSLLAGNINIVRVSQKTSDAQTLLVSVLADVLDERIGMPIKNRIVLMTYPHDDEITRVISAMCMVRVVWGGDATVNKIRSIPLRPTATEICFPDRFSACVIKSSSIVELGDRCLAELAKSFYNDAFWFAQQACSSPRLVVWIGGNEEVEIAKKRFWLAVSHELKQRQSDNSEAMSMSRLGASFEYAGAELARPIKMSGAVMEYPLRLEIESRISDRLKQIHCGNGLFLETSYPRLSDLAPQLSDKEQTLSVQGFSTAELREFALQLPARAIDRFSRIGDALSFAPVWDGQDLITAFSRRLLFPNNGVCRANI